MDLFWNLFEKSGSIEAYLAHKESQREKETEKNQKLPHPKNRHGDSLHF